RWPQRRLAEPSGPIRAASFRLPNPEGTTIPHPPIYALANFDPADITGSIGRQPLGDATAPLQFPKANRRSKQDSLVSRPREPMPPMPTVETTSETEPNASKKDASSVRFDPYSQYEFVTPLAEKTSTLEVYLPNPEL